MKNTAFFKLLLISQTIILLAYSFSAYQTEGGNLFDVFIANIIALNWSGQFNLDFLCYLVLSAIWIMWREKFTTKSIFVGVIAIIFGIVFFAPYLLSIIIKQNGNVKKVLIGER